MQLLKHAVSVCGELGDAWYYRSLVEQRLGHDALAKYAMDKARFTGSEALRQGLNPVSYTHLYRCSARSSKLEGCRGNGQWIHRLSEGCAHGLIQRHARGPIDRHGRNQLGRGRYCRCAGGKRPDIVGGQGSSRKVLSPGCDCCGKQSAGRQIRCRCERQRISNRRISHQAGDGSRTWTRQRKGCRADGCRVHRRAEGGADNLIKRHSRGQVGRDRRNDRRRCGNCAGSGGEGPDVVAGQPGARQVLSSRVDGGRIEGCLLYTSRCV